MTDTATDLPPLKNVQKWQQLEVDTFCVECGYNLHAQPVTRDERLGIFVCRCPECGRFHPAGVGVTAARPWMNRLATGLLVFWVLIVLSAIFWIVMGMGLTGVVHTYDFVNRKMVTADGDAAEYQNITRPGGGSGWQVVKKGTTQPVYNVKMRYTLEDVPDNTPWGFSNRRKYFDWWTFAGFNLMAAGIGFVTGILAVVFLWHWKRWGYRLALLLPFGVAAFQILLFFINQEHEEILGWAIRVVFGYALLQALFMALGLKVGRPIARGLLRMFVPPRPRQHFAFLWRVDGISPPQAAPLNAVAGYSS
jgi:hypothetical protein